MMVLPFQTVSETDIAVVDRIGVNFVIFYDWKTCVLNRATK